MLFGNRSHYGTIKQGIGGIMKISNNPAHSQNIAGVGNKNNQDKLSSSKENAAGISKGDIESAVKLKMSDGAQRIQKAKEIASNQSINEAKVERLQKLIDSGEYKVNASAVADRLVDEHLIMS